MSQPLLRIVVVGAAGRMGQEALRALTPEYGFEVVGAIVRDPNRAPFGFPAETNLAECLDRVHPDAVLDVSLAPAALPNAEASLSRKIPIVSGVTGISTVDIDAIRQLTEAHQTPMMTVSNFAIGVALMIRFAEIAAKWMPDVEIIERHHELKRDAPSGTAMVTAQRIAAARTKPSTVAPTEVFKVEGARGGNVQGIPVHSVRLPGSLAHQEILFGAPGETLILHHDATDRTVYMPGVRLCLSKVSSLNGLVVGMDALLFS